jgi:hypothetical protein
VLSTSNDSYAPAFRARTGWDNATGIGSVNVANLVMNWEVKTNDQDFNGDGKSDIVWRNTNGDTAIWLMTTQPGSPPVLQVLSQFDYGIVDTIWTIVGQRDFNGDGMADLLWSNTNGDNSIWLMNGLQVSQIVDLGNVGNNWYIVGTGDFNGDGASDILWRNTNGDTSVWLLTWSSNGTQMQLAYTPIDFGVIPTDWSIAGTGDFNGDGFADILWYKTSNGQTSIWLLTGTATTVNLPPSATNLGPGPTGRTIAGTGDFNGDGYTDILWSDSSGHSSIWLMTPSQTTPPTMLLLSVNDLGSGPANSTIAVTGDFNGDGRSDILWTNGTPTTPPPGGANVTITIWYMENSNYGTLTRMESTLSGVPPSWSVVGNPTPLPSAP